MMNNCTNNKTAFRPVRGNAFKLRIAVKAYRMDGSLVQDFVLDDSATLLLTTGNTVRSISYEVEDNCAIVSFDGSLACGYYGLEFSGVFNDEEWRFAAKNVFNVVELTAQADIPSDGIIYDDTYIVEASVTLATLGPQADWDEDDEASQSYIKNKPTMMLVGGDRETGKLTFYGRTLGDVLTTQQVIANLHMGVQLGIASDIYDPMEFSEQGEKYLYHLVSVNDDWLPGKALYELECNREGRNMSLTIYLENEDFYFDERLNFVIQPHINDLDAIRSGAAAGATAYQKPAAGIPKTDLASGVQASLNKADEAAPQATTYTKAEVDAALALKQTSSQLATINGSRIDQGGNVTIVAAEGQTITIDAAPTAGSNNAVSSGGVYNNVNGATEQSLEFTAGRGLNANGSTYNNTNASITDYIAVDEGDSISFEGSGANNYGAVAGYNASQVFVSNIITHTGSRINVTATIPSGIAYIRCAARNHTYNASTQDPEASLITFDPYIRTSKAVSTEAQNLSGSAKEQARNNIDASVKYLKEKYAEPWGSNGYYRYRTGTSELYFAGMNAFCVVSMIPIKVGMKIESNTTINAPYDLALNVFFGENAASPGSTPLAVAELTNGSITITQAMWDAGYRYIGISFRVADTPNPEVVVLTPLEAQVGYNKKDIISLQNDIEILKYNSTLFKVYIPSGNGKRVCYIFEKLYKKWDSLNYTDGQGQTQTLTNVVSSDYWNNAYICINDGFNAASEGYIIQGNTNMIYKLVGAAYHVGNGHGCEVALFRKFFIDGKEIDIEGMENKTSVHCKTFRYIQKSECFATDGTSNTYSATYPQIDTDGHPIVDAVHYMDCMFELGNRITINNRIQIQRDNLQFYVLYDAMLEVDYGKFTHVYVNTDDNTINQVLGFAPEQTTTVASTINLRQHPTNKASVAEMYGGDFFVRQIVIPDNAARQSKQWIDSVFYENTGRLKNYFGSVIGTHVAEALGETAEVFNAGDIIGCTAIREIELK